MWRRTRRVMRDASLETLSSASRLRFAIENLQRTVHLLEGRERQISIEQSELPPLPHRSCENGAALVRCVLRATAPWNELEDPVCEIPNMLVAEEKRYYAYLGQFYEGLGEVVEIGAWLGGSTEMLLRGLQPNPHFTNRRMWVFDDFIWRSSWMNGRLPGNVPEPANHASFRHVFDHYMEGRRDRLNVVTARVAVYDGNEHVRPLQWDRGEIELCVVDTGRTLAVNEGWYQVLEPSFIPGRTLLVLQDWHTYMEVPTRWFNQIKQFTDSKGDSLELVHELADGFAATFLYRG